MPLAREVAQRAAEESAFESTPPRRSCFASGRPPPALAGRFPFAETEGDQCGRPALLPRNAVGCSRLTSQRRLSVAELMDNYFSVERREWRCGECERVDALATTSLTSTPEVLICHNFMY